MRYGQITFATRLGLPLMALVLAACSGQQPGANPASQRSATLARGALIATVTATGNIQPEAEIRLGFQQAGTVAVVNVKVGDAIKKGDPLAKLDTADLEIGVAQAQSTLAQAQASLMIANANYSRTVEGPRKSDLDASEAVLSAAYANYEKVRKGPVAADYSGAEANLLNAEASLRSAQSAYDSQARRNPAGIGASPASVQLEQATNNYNAAKAQYDKLSQGADTAQLATAFQQIQSARAALEKA